jgi:hypothetical protein
LVILLSRSEGGFFMSSAQVPMSRDGIREKKCAAISRRNFLSFLAPLPLLPIVGPHMLLSEKPARLGWMAARTDPSPSDVARWCNSYGAGFNWKSVAERILRERDLEQEILHRQRLSARPQAR